LTDLSEHGGPLLFAGDTFCDLVFAGAEIPGPGEETWATSFTLSPGGVATRAVAAARMGGNSALLSRLGSDALGHHVHRMLKEEPGLDVSRLEIIDSAQSSVSVAISGAHDRSFVTYEERLPSLPAVAGDSRFAAIQISAGGEPSPTWIAEQRKRGAVVYGGVGWDGTGEWRGTLLERLTELDVFIANDVEAGKYTGLKNPVAAAEKLAEFVPVAVVTLGAKGAVTAIAASRTIIRTAAIRVPAVDPTGAGDVFTGALVATSHGPLDLTERLRLASAAASLSVTRPGGATSAPTWREVDRFLRDVDAKDGVRTSLAG
jgi:sugar/nucleoside kinase (ribokinase family)